MQEIKIAKSYLKNKNQDGMSKFHSWLAIIGITLGVTALIVVSSVMSGIFGKIYQDINIEKGYDLLIFDYDKKDINHIMNIIGKENIHSYIEYETIHNAFSQINENVVDLIVVNDEYLNNKEGLFLHPRIQLDREAIFVQLTGMFGDYLDQDLIKASSFSNDYADNNPIGLNDVMMTKSQFNESFYIDIIFKNNLSIKLNNFMDVNKIEEKLKSSEYKYNIDTWYKDKQQLLDNLTIENTVIRIVLFFIIIVSAFSVMSTITLIISEKKTDIFILKTIGYSDRSVLSIFLISGVILGILGIILGLLLGTVISLNMREILVFLEQIFHTKLFPPALKDFPVIIDYYDYIKVSILTLFVVFLSSFIPSIKTLKISPAEGLKNE